MVNLTPWERILEAGKKSSGIRLTRKEVTQLCEDQAIVQQAQWAAQQREKQKLLINVLAPAEPTIICKASELASMHPSTKEALAELAKAVHKQYGGKP
jgi:hypothetical protein